MRLFEYQAKGIFKKFGIPVPKYQITSKTDNAENIRQKIGGTVIIKAQVIKRGRSDFGGIVNINPLEDIKEVAAKILGSDIQGERVRKILIEKSVQIEKKYYLRIEFDPFLEKPVIFASKINFSMYNSANNQEADENLLKVPIDISLGLMNFQTRKIAVFFEINKVLWDKFAHVLEAMWQIYEEMDATVVGIEPMVQNAEGNYFALGTELELDDNALFRHSENVKKNKFLNDGLPNADIEQSEIIYFIKLGNIGCIVNSMAYGFSIMDMLYTSGSHDVIFPEVGLKWEKKKISEGLSDLFKTEATSCILVAMFGGLTKCDNVAKNLLATMPANTRKVPLVIYLNGTNIEDAKSALLDSGISVEANLENAIKKVIIYQEN